MSIGRRLLFLTLSTTLFGVAITLVSCGRIKTSDSKSIRHAFSVEPHPTDANLWNVSCMDGTHEVRTSNEVRNDRICTPGPKFVTTKKTVLTLVKKIYPGPITETKNCILPPGAVMDVWSRTPGDGSDRYEFNGSITSEIASECKEQVSSIYNVNMYVFSDSVTFKGYDGRIYGQDCSTGGGSDYDDDSGYGDGSLSGSGDEYGSGSEYDGSGSSVILEPIPCY